MNFVVPQFNSNTSRKLVKTIIKQLCLYDLINLFTKCKLIALMKKKRIQTLLKVEGLRITGG